LWNTCKKLRYLIAIFAIYANLFHSFTSLIHSFTEKEKKRTVMGLDTSRKGLIWEACNGKVN